MRPPILRWKVVLALIGILVISLVLGSVLGPGGKAPGAKGVQYFVTATPIYGPANAPPPLKRRICASMGAGLSTMPRRVRRKIERSTPAFCKRR